MSTTGATLIPHVPLLTLALGLAMLLPTRGALADKADVFTGPGPWMSPDGRHALIDGVQDLWSLPFAK